MTGVRGGGEGWSLYGLTGDERTRVGFLTYDRCKEKGGGRSLYGLTGDERTRVGFLIYDRCQERGGGGGCVSVGGRG